ncbi:unnamed protein product [Pleuronectes platessa]|uniref:Uncharacterized protein n=1 Tax=Pleuronectes platessa TaxID=8262 RepID=A0A9N7VD37_PLEPL|nr:unnamed protein product [Pleuronectes platessa]
MFIFVVKPLGTCHGWGSSRSVALLSAARGSVCGTGRSSSGGTSRRRRGRRAVGGDRVSGGHSGRVPSVNATKKHRKLIHVKPDVE